MKKSLYQCFNARVKFETIYCFEEHDLREINVRQLMRGDPLVLKVCQGCLDYDEMGPPVDKSERGWANLV